MKKINNKGYMLVEVIVSSVVAFVMVYFLMDITIKMVNKNNDYYLESVLLADKSLITKEIMDDINSKTLTNVYVDESGNSVKFTFEDTSKELIVYKDNKLIKYGDYEKKLTNELNIGNISISLKEDILKISIPGYTNYSKEDYGISIAIPYDASKGVIPPNIETKIVDACGASSPELTDNLIPVMYDESTNNWVVADTTDSTSNYAWYDYCNKKWANAVLLTESKRNSLTKNVDGSYAAGETIGDSYSEGVLAFYVWIPRYRYKVWNKDKIVGTTIYNDYTPYTSGIKIEFIGKDEEGTITCDYSYDTPSTAPGEPNEECSDVTNGTGYYTHPAFNVGVGDDKLTGIWVGKFELSSEDQTPSNYGGAETASKPRILPNVISWRNAKIDYFWDKIYNMQEDGNEYGLSKERTEVDSHMLTNMEWGAVAYLAHSEYGRCTSGDSSTCTEVAKNDSGETSYYTNYTGRSSGAGGSDGYTATGTYTYDGKDASTMEYASNRSLGMNASTTGNIYGIYDMNGGAWEYVMGNMSSTNTGYEYLKNYAGELYNYLGNEKFLTTYAYGETSFDQTAYNRGRLGDATSEIIIKNNQGDGGWYDDSSAFTYGDATNAAAWFVRGETSRGDNKVVGIFGFTSRNGSVFLDIGTRASLVVYNNE